MCVCVHVCVCVCVRACMRVCVCCAFYCVLSACVATSCSFEIDDCYWRNTQKGDSFYWARHSATRPYSGQVAPVDHTRKTAAGKCSRTAVCVWGGGCPCQGSRVSVCLCVRRSVRLYVCVSGGHVSV